MNETPPLQSNAQDRQSQDPPREERREWIEPTFERMSLTEAMGNPGPTFDPLKLAS